MADLYYRHADCGGTFYVDFGRESYGIAPCVYKYLCDKCGAEKWMPCIEEVRELASYQTKPAENQRTRVYKLS